MFNLNSKFSCKKVKKNKRNLFRNLSKQSKVKNCKIIKYNKNSDYNTVNNSNINNHNSIFKNKFIKKSIEIDKSYKISKPIIYSNRVNIRYHQKMFNKLSYSKNKYSEYYLNKKFEKLFNEKKILLEKNNLLKKNKLKEELKECTFSPLISKKYNIIKNNNKSKNSNIKPKKSFWKNKNTYKKFNYNKFKEYQVIKDYRYNIFNYLNDNYDISTGKKFFKPKISLLNKRILNRINLKTMKIKEKAIKLEKSWLKLFKILSFNTKYINIKCLNINDFDNKFLIYYKLIFINLFKFNSKINFEKFCDIIIDNNLIFLFIN